ncbi:TraB/GumN family protein [Candidatus Woesearchaeota archaeon]|nr:TraB/GumN family protein [Candidatus Woesearchaeota archaeon]
MQAYKNILLLGSSHVAEQSIREVKEAIELHQPVVVAVELDKKRYYALLHPQKKGIGFSQIFNYGVTGFLFAALGSFVQKHLGKAMNITPGSEMLTAVKEAQRHGRKVQLIDQDIEITLQRFSKLFTWREKFRMVGEFFSGIFFHKRQLKKLGLDNFDLSRVPEQKVIEKMIGHLRERYPGMYRALIGERNTFMAKRLIRLSKEHPEDKILAVVGAGHLSGMLEEMKKEWHRVEVVQRT